MFIFHLWWQEDSGWLWLGSCFDALFFRELKAILPSDGTILHLSVPPGSTEKGLQFLCPGCLQCPPVCTGNEGSYFSWSLLLFSKEAELWSHCRAHAPGQRWLLLIVSDTITPALYDDVNCCLLGKVTLVKNVFISVAFYVVKTKIKWNKTKQQNENAAILILVSSITIMEGRHHSCEMIPINHELNFTHANLVKNHPYSQYLWNTSNSF